MAMCADCKKAPLEYREMNHVSRGGVEVVLCDECYRKAFCKKHFRK